MADKKMEAQISVEFEEATSRQSLNSGERINILWSKVKRWLSDLKAVAFSGSYSDLSDTPTTATTTHDGLMSAEDKTKLDGADNNYALKSKYGDTTINVGRKADTVIGAYSTAEGRNATASGTYSHAEGNTTTASNAYCHAEGYSATASGESSHAEGYNTTASKQYSHAEGCRTTASGESSHAEGYSTTASGSYSHTEGLNTIASGFASHAGGTGTKALHDNEVAYGKYNESKDDTVFSVGDGTSDSARHNAFEITTTGGKLHDKDIATTDLIPTELPANGGNADTLSSKSIDYFMHWRNETIVNPDTCEAIGIYQWATPTTITINPIAYGTLIVSNAFGFKCQIVIGVDTSVFVRHKTYDQEWSAWRNVSDGGNADYATNAGNAEKLGGKDASAYSTSIIKSVTFSATTTNGYIWTGIPFPKYVIGVDLEHFDVIVQFYKGNHADAARAEWTMMFLSKDDVTTPLNGSFTGRIYYID